MGYEEDIEKGKSTTSQSTLPTISLQETIKRGEYDPDILGGFPEWHAVSRHTQFQYIREAIQNRERQLVIQWAEINNVLNFSEKPHLQEALRNIEEQKRKLQEDKEHLYLEYSKP
ncbi:MAG: hypothetical protein ACREGI_06040 [Candidatus Levyibacteriota bacterium]